MTLTYADAAQLALPGLNLPGLDRSATGCHIDENVEPETVDRALRYIDQMLSQISWNMGDLNVEVLKRKRDGQDDWLHVEQSEWQVISAYCARLVLLFPPERRRTSLRWAHHNLVATMNVDDQDHFLDLAEERGLTASELKGEIEEEMERRNPRLDDMPLPLKPYQLPREVGLKVSAIMADDPAAVLVVRRSDGTEDVVS